MKESLIIFFSLITVCSALNCTYKEIILKNACDLSQWLDWDCSSCGGILRNGDAKAVRKRVICCKGESLNITTCLQKCNLTESAVTKLSPCSSSPCENLTLAAQQTRAPTISATSKISAATLGLTITDMTKVTRSTDKNGATELGARATTSGNIVSIETTTSYSNVLSTTKSVAATTSMSKSRITTEDQTTSFTNGLIPKKNTSETTPSSKHDTGTVVNVTKPMYSNSTVKETTITTATNGAKLMNINDTFEISTHETNATSENETTTATGVIKKEQQKGLSKTAVAAISASASVVGVVSLVVIVIFIFKKKKAGAVLPTEENEDSVHAT